MGKIDEFVLSNNAAFISNDKMMGIMGSGSF
jgi:hypothetical protein